MTTRLCLVEGIGEDESVTSCWCQSGLLGRDGMRTVSILDTCYNGHRGSQNGRSRVVYSDDDTSVSVFHYKEVKTGGKTHKSWKDVAGGLSWQAHTRVFADWATWESGY